jgi:hypothetical protein
MEANKTKHVGKHGAYIRSKHSKPARYSTTIQQSDTFSHIEGEPMVLGVERYSGA